MKTIEKIAKQFTDELFAHDDLTDFDTQTEKNDAYVMCMAFGNHLMEQPLSDRLTAEEREKMLNLYCESEKCHKSCSNSICNNQTVALDNEYKRGINKGVMLALKHIFGKEMFAEEGGKK